MRARLKGRGRVGLVCGTEGGAKQSFRDECDVSQIVAKFRKTGLVTHLAKGQPRYIDVSAVPDFRAALDHVNAVGVFFDGLPADLREHFDNDPAEFIDGMNDPQQIDFLRSYGVEPVDKAPSSSEAPKGASGEDGADKEP